MAAPWPLIGVQNHLPELRHRPKGQLTVSGRRMICWAQDAWHLTPLPRPITARPRPAPATRIPESSPLDPAP